MDTLLRLTRIPYEEPYHIRLLVEASNGRQYGSIEYYTNADDLPDLGRALHDFPFGKTKEHVYEIGSEDLPLCCAYYVRLRFFLIRPTGQAGIELRFSNNRQEAPYREVAEFTIGTEIAAINRLGELLTNFGRLEHRVLEWNGVDGFISKPEDKEEMGHGEPRSVRHF